MTTAPDARRFRWTTALLAVVPFVRRRSGVLEPSKGSVALGQFDPRQRPQSGLISYRTFKRLLDLVCVTLALPLALPLLAVASLGVRLSMGGPILFVQSRVGLEGKVFRMIKLRTMRVAVAGAAIAATGERDPRITPLGRWLRRFRIDEIPQLWNVVVGDMSLVGPRPEWTVLADGFSAQEPAYNFRHLVRPGITGWAQVLASPAADLGETRVKLGYDLFYIEHMSFALDLQILVRTLWTLLAGGGVR